MKELWAALERIAAAVAHLRQAMPRLWTATVRSVSPLVVDGEIELKSLGWYEPSLNDSVLVLQAGQAAYILGTLTPNRWRDAPGATGTVGTVTGGSFSVPVTVGGVVYAMPFPGSYTPVAGHTVGVVWVKVAGGWAGHITGQLQATVPTTANPGRVEPPVVDPPPSPAPVSQTFYAELVQASTSATWRSGGWRTDKKDHVYQGTFPGYGANHGYWWHPGFKGYRGATITAADIWLSAMSGVGITGPVPVRLALHSSMAKGATEPTVIATSSTFSMSDGQQGWFAIPASFAQQLADGTAGGIGVVSDTEADYSAFHGLSSYVNSGAVRVTGTR